MKKKEFVFTEELRGFVRKLPEDTRRQLYSIILKLEDTGFLVLPYGKKLSGYDNLFEIRVLSGRSVRVFYCYRMENHIVGLSGFEKKTLKTPKQEIKKALKIIKKLEA